MSEANGSRRVFWPAVVMITATYGYFLIFAQFAFLELLKEAVGAGGLRVAMGAMGVGGTAGSLLAAWRFRAKAYAGSLRWISLVCAVAAAWSCVEASAWTAGVIGLALGGLTVTLVAGLRGVLAGGHLGLAVGLGTGCAYAACNVPWVFHAAPRVQAGVGILFMLAGVVAAGFLPARAGAEGLSEGDFTARRAVVWTVIFMALVWMDSAAFYIIQHTAELRAGTWGANGSLWLNAGMHLLVAVAAGWALDRGWPGRVVGAAWVALAAACVLLGESVRAWVGAEIFYTAGVSLYSVALVYYPARAGRAWLAGGVFAVAGWMGSALGIGMAQDLHRVPAGLVIMAGVVVLGLLWTRGRGVVVLVVAVGLLVLPGSTFAAEEALPVVRGREVFIGEGCIHCHSQYVRPGTVDVVRWGPEKPLAESLAEAPPLLGNRRQGPDLSQVGNRRSPEWNRLHLIAPRQVSPGSRMPSYGYLFREGETRGDDLVAYLASLGAETAEARAAQVAGWSPPAVAAADAANGGRLFATLCVNCHGPRGQGDGVLAGGLSVRPPDWPRDGGRRVAKADEVARIIKFGLPGTPMAGHEYLRDEELVSLAAYVRNLQGGATGP